MQHSVVAVIDHEVGGDPYLIVGKSCRFSALAEDKGSVPRRNGRDREGQITVLLLTLIAYEHQPRRSDLGAPFLRLARSALYREQQVLSARRGVHGGLCIGKILLRIRRVYLLDGILSRSAVPVQHDRRNDNADQQDGKAYQSCYPMLFDVSDKVVHIVLSACLL